MLESLSIVFIAFGGFLLSLFLFHKKRRKSEPFICPLRGRCSEVIHSDYSKFFGLPVEIIGLMYYASIALGHGLVLGFPHAMGWLDLALLVASMTAFLFSLYLTFIQVVALRKLCTWCLLSATFCLSIFVLTVLKSVPTMTPFSFWTFLKIYFLVLVITVSIGKFVENRLAHRRVPWPSN